MQLPEPRTKNFFRGARPQSQPHRRRSRPRGDPGPDRHWRRPAETVGDLLAQTLSSSCRAQLPCAKPPCPTPAEMFVGIQYGTLRYAVTSAGGVRRGWQRQRQ
ncbi:hypothetical protein NDU88_006590 [Pleurodeles waltl]|uniref:Uncharacterized protein n=1 Tax=Pleurodeles waltl TaxID=8319 RepID=A0AAV7VQ73_PLEWA|nr:hypothetical protein NDU88_006590 [Pleurodeles waltl]